MTIVLRVVVVVVLSSVVVVVVESLPLGKISVELDDSDVSVELSSEEVSVGSSVVDSLVMVGLVLVVLGTREVKSFEVSLAQVKSAVHTYPF